MGLPDQDERTLPPTEKRIKEFRKRGEVARSRDLTAVSTIIGGAIVGGMSMPSAVHELLTICRTTFIALGDKSGLAVQGQASIHAFTGIVAPPLVGALAGCILVGVGQLGAPPVLSFPSIDPSRLLNFGQIASMFNPKEGLGRAALAVAKVGVVLAAAYFAVRAAAEHFSGELSGASQTAGMLSSLISRVIWFAGSALVVLAIVDFVIKKRDLNARMRMTKEEHKREHREAEGAPEVKRKRRQRMRELARRKLKKNVETADIILVNPTEYAVALRYRSKEDRAPRVVAKGRGVVAERIREMARAAGVPILASPPLTRLIHKLVKEGREIPASLYQAVAEVMAYVYKIRGPRRAD